MATVAKFTDIYGHKRSFTDSVKRIYERTFSKTVFDIYATHLGWNETDDNRNGKLIRPLLTLFGCRAAGGKDERFLMPAIAVETIHEFSLIHDDIEDQDRWRRGRRTVWDIHGVAKAVVVGDELLPSVHRVLEGVGDVSLPIQTILNDAYLGMVEGQHLDLLFESHKNTRFDDYLTVVDLKAGRLLTAAIVVGAVAVDSNASELIRSLERFGVLFGRIFQMRDDMLGVWGDKRTGKTAGNDIWRRKFSLPAVYLLNFAKPRVISEARGLYAKPEINEQTYDRILELITAPEVYRWCHDIADGFRKQARYVLHKAALPREVRKDLIEFCDYLLVRDF